MKRQLKRAQGYISWMDSKLCALRRWAGIARASRNMGWRLSSRRHRVLLALTTLRLSFESRKSYYDEGQLSGHTVYPENDIARQE
jgi:hypothetical protein